MRYSLALKSSAGSGPDHLGGDDDADDDAVQTESGGENLDDQHADEGRGGLGVGKGSARADDAHRDPAEEVGQAHNDARSKAGIARVLSLLVGRLVVVNVEVVGPNGAGVAGCGQFGLHNDRDDHTVDSYGFAEDDRN